LGVAGSVCEVAIDRFYPALADRETVNGSAPTGTPAEAATPRDGVIPAGA